MNREELNLKKLLLVSIGILLITALFLVGCSSSTTTTQQTTTTTQQSTTTSASQTSASTTLAHNTGGIFKQYINEPFCLGYPATMTGQTDGQSAQFALETLFVYDPQGNITPLLATGYTVDAPTKTILISLRKDVKFHDGSDFNADVCKWNLDQYRAGVRAELKSVSSVDVVDEYTVKLTLSTFDSTIMDALCNGADAGRMISQTAFDAHGTGKDAQTWAEKNPVGTGPWQFVSWTKDVGIKFERFDGYWDGKPYLDGIELVRFSDFTAALMAFKSGQLSVFPVSMVSPSDVAPMQAEGSWNWSTTPIGQVPALAGAADDPYFSQLKVRQAMSYAIDTAGLNAGIGKGLWIESNQWAIPGTWGFNPDVVGYPYNPEKAKQLLAEAGYPDGINTVMHFYNSGGSQTDLMTAIQSQLKAVGINADLDPMLRPAFVDIASAGKGFTGIVCMQGNAMTNPLLKFAQVRAGNEFTGVLVSDHFKQVYDQARQASDQETMQNLVREMMKISIDEDCMHVPLGINAIIYSKSKTLHDDEFGEIPNNYLSPKAWME